MTTMQYKYITTATAIHSLSLQAQVIIGMGCVPPFLVTTKNHGVTQQVKSNEKLNLERQVAWHQPALLHLAASQ